MRSSRDHPEGKIKAGGGNLAVTTSRGGWGVAGTSLKAACVSLNVPAIRRFRQNPQLRINNTRGGVGQLQLDSAQKDSEEERMRRTELKRDDAETIHKRAITGRALSSAADRALRERGARDRAARTASALP